MVSAADVIHFTHKDTVNFDSANILWIRIPLKNPHLYQHNKLQLEVVTPAGKVTLEDSSYTLLPLGDTTEVIIDLATMLNRHFAETPDSAELIFDRNNPANCIVLARHFWHKGYLFAKN